jgi:hypothetical protein
MRDATVVHLLEKLFMRVEQTLTTAAIHIGLELVHRAEETDALLGPGVRG